MSLLVSLGVSTKGLNRAAPAGAALGWAAGAGAAAFGAGAASGGVMDASNLLKPLLSSGDLKCIGSTTYQEYKNIFEKDY